MAKTKGAQAQAAMTEVAQDTVEIVFDFTRIGLWDFLDMMESSANAQDGKPVSAEDTMRFIRILRSAFISSSRELTMADFDATIKSFWKQAELFKNPNG